MRIAIAQKRSRAYSFLQVSGFKDVSFLGRADVSSQAQAIDERKRFPRKMPTP
jgi:hypothetical protein